MTRFAAVLLAAALLLPAPGAVAALPLPAPGPASALPLPAPGSASAPRRNPRRTPAPRPAPRIVSAGDRISLDLKDADIRDVLRTFATLQHFNLVIDPEVKGSVTVRLVDVRWEQALDVILRSNGLAYEMEGTIVRVQTPH